MTGTMARADIRGYYEALGVELPGWAQAEASVRCFADPDAHAHQDRNASCSVNLETGAWRCWGCGARGGAYDAAIALGRTPRAAIDLMIHHGLTERRSPAPLRRRRRADAEPKSRRSVPHPQPRRRALAATEADVARWHRQLAALSWPPSLLRPEQRQLWSRRTLLELGCGWAHGRVTIPIRGQAGDLQGVLRYAPSHDHAPKMLAIPGTRLGLLPHPAAAPSKWTLLVEGPPDMISARSQGLPAIAVSGDDAWDPDAAQQLKGRKVLVAMDCDRPGRQAAQRILTDLDAAGVTASRVDLAPGRDDGYDLTDWFSEQPLERGPIVRRLRALAVA